MAKNDYIPRKTLYQYCSFEGFCGIIENKKLWLSDLRQMNDPRELKFGKEKIGKAISDLTDYEPLEIKRRAIQQFGQSVISSLDSTQFFTSCFTEKADSMRMWQAYADNGKGICIGFRPTAISDMFGRIQKVEYLDADDESVFHNYIKKFITEVEAGTFDGDEMAFAQQAPNMVAKIVCTKHDDWSDEGEIRLTVAQLANFEKRINRPEDAWGIDERRRVYKWQIPKQRKRKKNGNKNEFENVDYIELSFGKWENKKYNSNRSIETVIVGPNSDLSAHKVKSLLEASGYYGVTVISSNCRFRI